MDAKTYKEKEERIPFQDDVNVSLFFPGAQRRELVDDVLTALHDEVTFLSISGEEGTGKTMICRMVEKEIAESYLCLYLPENIESFEDVIGVFSERVGLVNERSSKEVAEQEEDLIRFLREKKQRLVVIFDNAEKMYLAMLERLRKLLDRMNSEEPLLQIILSGRRVLYENLEQLEICEFNEIEEVHFHLSALEQSEIYAYLNHCAKLRSRELGKCMFSSEAAKKIFSLSKGNLKLTNRLAAKAIASADAEDSFVVHPKNVIIEDELASSALGRFHLLNLFTSSSRKSWIIAGSGIVVLIILLFVFMMEEDKQQEKTSLPTQQRESVTTTIHQDQTADPVAVNSAEVEIQSQSTGQDEKSGQDKEGFIVVKPANVDAQADKTEKPPASSMADAKKSQPTPALGGKNGKQLAEQQKKKETGLADEASSLDSASVDKSQSGHQSEGQASQSQTSDARNTPGQVVVSQLTVKEHMDDTGTDASQVKEELTATVQKTGDQKTAAQEVKKNEDDGDIAAGDDSPVLRDTSKTAPLRVANIAEPKQLPRIAPVKLSSAGTKKSRTTMENSAKVIPADILYQQRLLAGRQMLLQKQRDYKTIQLMALTTGKAEENLQSSFSRKEYREIADNLYIVKSTDNSKVFVYYGQFADDDAAQQARKTLPPFLSKSSPYVISLEEARRKTNLNQ